MAYPKNYFSASSHTYIVVLIVQYILKKNISIRVTTIMRMVHGTVVCYTYNLCWILQYKYLVAMQY